MDSITSVDWCLYSSYLNVYHILKDSWIIWYIVSYMLRLESLHNHISLTDLHLQVGGRASLIKRVSDIDIRIKWVSYLYTRVWLVCHVQVLSL